MIDDITVFDFETSGLDPEKDQVIELAAIRCIKGEIVSSFSTLIQYDKILAPKITELTGIKQSDLVNGMTERHAFAILRNLMGNSTIVAHNAGFDLGFLHYTLLRLDKPTFSNRFIDTMTICRERYTYRSKPEGHKLEGMCTRLGIKLEGAHRALADVYACWELLKLLHAESPIDQFLNQLGYMRKYGPPKWMPSYADPFPTDNRYENNYAN